MTMTDATFRSGAVARILPDVLFDVRRPQRLIERSMMVYRRSWMVIFSGFFEPLFYLLSIRVGLSTLVGEIEVGERLIPYEEFVAPGLMAAAAMNGAVTAPEPMVSIKAATELAWHKRVQWSTLLVRNAVRTNFWNK